MKEQLENGRDNMKKKIVNAIKIGIASMVLLILLVGVLAPMSADAALGGERNNLSGEKWTNDVIERDTPITTENHAEKPSDQSQAYSYKFDNLNVTSNQSFGLTPRLIPPENETYEGNITNISSELIGQPPTGSSIWQFNDSEQQKIKGICQAWRAEDNITPEYISVINATMRYNIFNESVDWVTTIYYNNSPLYTIGLQSSGEMGWLARSNQELINISSDDAINIVEENGIENYTGPKLTVAKGGTCWRFQSTENTSRYYLVSAYSGSISNLTLEEIDETHNHTWMGAYSATEIQPDLVPYYSQMDNPKYPRPDGTQWCGPYSVTMVLSWWDAWGPTSSSYNAHNVAEIIASFAQANPHPNPDRGTYIGCLDYAVRETTKQGAWNWDKVTTWHGDMKSLSSCDPDSQYLDDIKGNLREGYPTIVEVDTPLGYHAVVVTGYNDVGNNPENQNLPNYVVINDPSGALTGMAPQWGVQFDNIQLEYSAFESAWNHEFGDWDKPWENPHKHRRPGLVIYPGNWNFPNPTCTLTPPPSPINVGDTFTLTATLKCTNGDADASGIHIRTPSNLEITGYSTSDFNAVQVYDENHNTVSLPAHIIEFYRTSMTKGTTYTAYITFHAVSWYGSYVCYRGWATDKNDHVHCGYDWDKINPWETKYHTTDVWDDRNLLDPEAASPIQMPRVESLIQRDPSSTWWDDRWQDTADFTNYPLYPHSLTITDTTPPSNLQVSINNDARYTNSRSVNLLLSATDVGTTASKMRFSNNDGTLNEDRCYLETFKSYSVATSISSSHPYSNNYDNTWELYNVNAKEMRIHFTKIETGSDWDWICIYDQNHNEILKYSGAYTDLWTPWISSNTLYVRLATGVGKTYWGFKIDKYEYEDGSNGYPDNCDRTWSITKSDASMIRVKFYRIDVENGCDYLYIYNKNGEQITRYTGSHTEVWTPWVSGDTIKIRLTSDGSISEKGFYIMWEEWYTPNWSPWEPYSTSKTWDLSTGDEDKTVLFEVKDYVGNIAIPVSSTIILDTTPPTSAVTTPAEGATITGMSYTLTGTAYDAGSGVKKVEISTDGGITWYNAAGTESWSYTWNLPLDGGYTIKTRATDNLNHVETPSEGTTVNIANTPTDLSILINNGDEYTTPTNVILTLSATDQGAGISKMCFSNDGVTWTDWEIYTVSKGRTLPSGDGTKYIYFRVKDNIGNIAEAVSDTIILDTTPPFTLGIPTDAGEWSTSTTITFTWTASTDDTSGIAGYWLQVGTTLDGNDVFDDYVGNVLTYDILCCQNGVTYYVRVKAMDNAGLESFWSDSSDGITVDTEAPTITLGSPSISESSTYLYATGTTIYYSDLMGINSQPFTVQGTALDDGSGLGYATATTAFGDSQGTDYDPSSWSWTYTVIAADTGDGVIIVTVYDNAGNHASKTFNYYEDLTNPSIVTGSWSEPTPSEYLYIDGTKLYFSNLMSSTVYARLSGTASDTNSGLCKTVFSYESSLASSPRDCSLSGSSASWQGDYGINSASTQGDGNVVVTLYDSVGNYVTDTFYYYRDTRGPYSPSLSSPENNAVIHDRKPGFSWSYVGDPSNGYYGSGTDYYRLQIDTTTGFSSANLIDIIIVDSPPYALGADLDFNTYYWHVGAKDNVGSWGDWSSTWGFTVEKFYDVNLEPESQRVFRSSGSGATFTIMVANTGNDYDTITLTTTLGTLSTGSVSLDYGQSTSITLTLTASSTEGDTVTAMVTGRSYGDSTKYDSVSCSVTTKTEYHPPPKRIIIHGGIHDGLIDGFEIGIGGRIDLPGMVLDGDLDRLPGGRDDFCINKIIDVRPIRPIFDLPGFGLPGFFPHPWYCEADIFPHPWYCDTNNIYQTYYVNVSNPFNSTIIVNLSVYGVPEGWDGYLSNYSVTLEPDEYAIVILTVVIPKTTMVGQTTVWVLGTIQDYDYVFMYGINVTVGQIPVPIIRVEASYPVILENDVLVFNASYSYDPDGTIVSYEWDFSDGTNGTGMAVEHSYGNAGNYVVTLVVRDNYNLTNSTTIVVSVEHHSFEVEVRQITTEVRAGETAVYMINIENTGTISDTYVLRMIDMDSSWSYPNNVYVGVSAGRSITLYLKVTVPSDYPLMYNTTYNFTITVSCMHDSAVMSNAPLTYIADETLTVIATKESKTRYIINEVDELITLLDNMSIQQGIKNSLKSKLENALDKLNTTLDDILNGDETHANNMLNCAQNQINAFINEVEAQRGKKISENNVDTPTAISQIIIEHINDTIATPSI